MYLLRKGKGNESLIFWAAVWFAVSGAAALLFGTGITALAFPLLKLASYIIMLSYFYRAFLKHLMDEYDAIRKKLSAVDRSIEAEVKKRMQEVEKVNKRLLDKSKTDPLTGLLNKAAVFDAIDRLITGKPDREHSILMFDIDDFKEINDTHGTPSEQCIKILAAPRSNFRGIDIIGRYVVMNSLPYCPKQTRLAVAIADRFRKVVDKTTNRTLPSP